MNISTRFIPALRSFARRTASSSSSYSSYSLSSTAAGLGVAGVLGFSGLWYSSNDDRVATTSSTQGTKGETIYEVNCHVDSDVADAFKAWLRPHYAELLKLDGFQTAEMFEVEAIPDDTPNVLFVLGGPGAGKGTQCANIVANYDYEHISAGDCLRAERNNPNSENGALINDYIKRGAIVPVEITIALLLKKMKSSPKSKFLIDGFPRNADNLTGWYNVVGDKANVEGVLFFDCSEATLTKRLLGRAEAAGANRRKDDNIESIRNRFTTYAEKTRPIIETYANMGKVMTVNANDGTIDEIFSTVKPIIEKIDEKLTKKPTTTITSIYRVDSRAQLTDYFDNHAARLRGDGLKAFSGKFTADRRVMQSVDKL
jgi:UMP-CMP kinase